jgi:hypothetical protein
MARNLMIAVGVVLWGTFAAYATALYLIGHWIAPTVTLIVGVSLMAIRAMQHRTARRRPVEAAR